MEKYNVERYKAIKPEYPFVEEETSFSTNLYC
jgi:hypothetical protein